MKPFEPLWVHVDFPAEDLRAICQNPKDFVVSRNVHFGEVGVAEVRLEIPTFQRGLRWGPKKRKEFLDSLRQG